VCFPLRGFRSLRELRSKRGLDFKLGDDEFELNFMIAPQLVTDAILGAVFLNEFHVVLDFSNCSFVKRHERFGKETPLLL
jgi:hypothetical protein